MYERLYLTLIVCSVFICVLKNIALCFSSMHLYKYTHKCYGVMIKLWVDYNYFLE